MIETKPRINRGNRGQLFRATWLSSARCSERERERDEKSQTFLTHVHGHGLAFLISHLTRQRHFSGPLFIVRGDAMTWAGSGRDLGLSEVTATCIWRNIRLARLFF